MTPTNALAEKLDVGVMRLSRELGNYLGAQPLPEIPEIAVMPVRLTRKSVWPPEVWAEIEAIYEEKTR